MKVRYKSKNGDYYVEGQSSDFNTHGIGEAIVYFDDGSCDSMFLSELEVLIPDIGWLGMGKAFEEKHIVPDNYNVWFGLPSNEESRERGWND